MFGTTAKKLLALDCMTGDIIWQFNWKKLSDYASGTWCRSASPVVAGNDVYSIAYPRMIALDSKTGKVNWRLQLASRCQDDLSGGLWEPSPAIGSDGTIYVSTNDGNLFAIQ
jgi:outer membrane protein assembly factor BamB